MSKNMERKIKILNFTGWGRSGSTILGSVLGEIPGFFFGGEIRTIWSLTMLKNRLCGCGVPSKECQIWSEIINKAFGGFNSINVNPKEMMTLIKSGTRTGQLALMLLPFWEKLQKENLKPCLENIEKLYHAVQSITGSNVIIDSSKSSGYSNLLGMIPSFDLYIVHLIRDPRAVTYSWQRKKALPDKNEKLQFNQYSALGSSVRWSIRNLASEAYWKRHKDRYFVMRYEDFIEKPKKSVQEILNFIGEKPLSLPFVGDHSVQLGLNHALWGNPSRFKTGVVELKKDDEWKEKMKASDKILTTALTWPLLLKYEYKA